MKLAQLLAKKKKKQKLKKPTEGGKQNLNPQKKKNLNPKKFKK